MIGTVGINAIVAMTYDELDCIPEVRVVLYARILIDFRPKKEYTNKVYIRSGEKL